MAANKMKPCNCRSWDFGTWNGIEAEDFESYGTGCGESTYKVFAMGHDAKLVGFLVRAELAGEEISQTEGGVRITFPGAVAAAASISDRLAAKAQAQLEAAKARAAKKANRPAKTPKQAMDDLVERQAAAEVAKANSFSARTREAQIKVGRWTRDAVIDIETGVATYRAKLTGQEMAVEPGKYTEV